jgi:hypothetical protein
MTAFAAMKGGEVLAHIHGILLKVAADKRSYLEQSAAIGGAPVADSELAEVNALGAAADVFQFAISAGQEARIKNRDPPGWLMHMAAQARAALTAPSEGDEQG